VVVTTILVCAPYVRESIFFCMLVVRGSVVIISSVLVYVLDVCGCVVLC
jgi:hypothetical protein